MVTTGVPVHHRNRRSRAFARRLDASPQIRAAARYSTPPPPPRPFHRLIKAIVFTAIVFVRLDVQLFPGFFGKLDAPYMGYYSMLYIEDNFHNPIRVVFLAFLLQKRLVWHQVPHPPPPPTPRAMGPSMM